MNVLVTGATGLLGSNLVQRLCREGLSPRVLVRRGSDRRALEGLEVTEHEGDLMDTRSLEQALSGVEAVYHCAGLVRFDPGARSLLHRINAEGTRQVLEAARQAGVRRVVHVSSIATIGYGPLAEPASEESATFREDDNPYAQSKIAAEEIARAANGNGLEVIIANPAVVIGARDVKPTSGQILLLVARGLARFYPSGGTNYVNASDVADGLVRLMAHGIPGERYVLGGENLTHRDFLTQCAKACGVSAPSLPLPERLLAVAARGGDWLGRVAPDRFQNFNSATVASMRHAAYVSSGKAQRTVGYLPRPVRLGIHAAYDWFQRKGYLPADRPLTPDAPLADQG
jgi:dihydroflavonol-4-reductase